MRRKRQTTDARVHLMFNLVLLNGFLTLIYYLDDSTMSINVCTKQVYTCKCNLKFFHVHSSENLKFSSGQTAKVLRIACDSSCKVPHLRSE